MCDPAGPTQAAPPAGTTDRAAFFTGAGLPLFLLSAMLVYEAFLLAVVLVPESSSLWSGFAREFKQWCFRYDARTGGMEWAAFWVMLAEPLFVVSIAVLLSRRALMPLRTFAGWATHWKSAAAGVTVAAIAMAALYAYGRPAADAGAPLPFPGERIRTHLQMPPFQFVDHKGAVFSIEELRGRVVLLTAVYAQCPTGACSSILQETKALLETLPLEARARLSVVALSLNPGNDTPELMNTVTKTFDFTYPEFRYLNGEPAALHDLTMRLGFAPVRNASTGVIDHANLFFLLDARGEIAYRLTLDERHRSWLHEGILALAREAAAP